MGNEFDCRREVERILNGDNQICGRLYSEMMSFLLNLNKTGRVKVHTLKDIAQNAMMKFILNLQNDKFQYQSTLSTYLKAIAKNEFYKYFDKKKEILPIEDTRLTDELADDLPEDLFVNDIRWKIYQEEFNKLREECQKLLHLSIKKMNKFEIAEQMSYNDPEIVRERLYRCKLRLVQLVRSNSLFNKIKDHDE